MPSTACTFLKCLTRPSARSSGVTICPPVNGGGERFSRTGGWFFENQTPRSPAAHGPLHRGPASQRGAPACGRMVFRNFDQRRDFGPALLDRERTARVKAAAARKRRGIGHDALDRAQALLL